MAEETMEALPPGTKLEWLEDGRLAVTPLSADNSLGHPVLAWPEPIHEWKVDRVFVYKRREGWLVSRLGTDRSKADLEQLAADMLWEAEDRIRKFIEISRTTRERAILYLFAHGAEIASQVKLAERGCDTRRESAWRQGAVVGALGGVVVGTAVSRLITWLKK